MGKGLSTQQCQLLGLAMAVCRIRERPGRMWLLAIKPFDDSASLRAWWLKGTLAAPKLAPHMG